MIGKIKRLVSFAAVFVLSFSALSVLVPQSASAAVRTWDAGGDGVSWNDAANWSSNTAPVNGDSVTFDVSILSGSTTLNNNISNLSLAGINRTGTSASNYNFTVTGNAVTLTGALAGATDGQMGYLRLNINVTLGTNLLISSASHISTDADWNVGSYTLTISGATNYFGIQDLSGSGDITIQNSGDLSVFGSASGYTGEVNVISGMFKTGTSLGDGGSITVSGDSTLSLLSDGEFTTPVTLGGTGSAAMSGVSLGMSGHGVVSPIVLSGGVTLTSDITIYTSVDLTIEEPYTPNGHSIRAYEGMSGKVILPGGASIEPEAKTTTIDANDKQPNKAENINNKQTYIIDGERGNVYIGSGGTLKGVGTVASLSASSGAKVAPGHSPGSMKVLTSLTLNEGSTFELELKNKDEYDRFQVGENHSDINNPAVQLENATLEGFISEGFNITASDTFTIINNLSDTDVDGTFKDLPEGATFKISDGVFKITYVGGDGNDVVLSVVTVPSTPNSGSKLLFANPYIIIAATLATAGASYYLLRRYTSLKSTKA